MARKRKEPGLIVINDLGRQRSRDIRVLLDRRVGTGGYKIVDASAVRKKVYGHLSKTQGYDLILLGDTGGPKVFDEGVARYGKDVKRIPYSEHYPTWYEKPMKLGWKGVLKRKYRRYAPRPWPDFLRKEVRLLGKKPRVLLLESDLGESLQTVLKLKAAKDEILGLRKDAVVDVVAGVGRSAPKFFKYVAYPTSGANRRASELSSLLGMSALPGFLGEAEISRFGRKKLRKFGIAGMGVRTRRPLPAGVLRRRRR